MAQFQLPYAGLGTLIGLYMAPGIFVALPGGLLGRRYGERIVVGLGFFLMTAGATAGSLVATPSGIGWGRVIAGAGAVMLIVMQGQMVSERFPGRAFMPVMGLLTGAFPVGVGLAALIRDPVLHVWGWPAMFVVGAALAGVSLVLFLLTCGAPRIAGRARWALPSRHESILVIVAGLIWTAYNAGYYGL